MKGLYRVVVWTITLYILLLLVIPLILWTLSFRWHFPALLPTQYSLRAWQAIFDPTKQIGTALLNSLYIACMVTIIDLLIGLPVARMLQRIKKVRRWITDLIVLFPLLITPLAIVMGLYSALSFLNIVNNVLAIIVAHVVASLPYMIIILRAIFTNFDRRYEEVAASLGAPPFQVAYYVTLSLLAPAILVSSLFVFLISWSQYLSTLLMGGGRLITLPLLMISYASAGDYPLMSVVTLIQFVPPLIFLVLNAFYLSGRSYGIERAFAL